MSNNNIYQRGGPEEINFQARKMSISLSQNILNDVERIMKEERVDNLSWFIRRLLRIALERYDNEPYSVRLGQTTFKLNPPPILAEILLKVAERVRVTPEYIILDSLQQGINKWVEKANGLEQSIRESIVRMEESARKTPTTPAYVPPQEDSGEEDLENMEEGDLL